MKNKTYKVFVYGSLKDGFGNNIILSDSNKIKDTITKNKYEMISLGSFPAVLKEKQVAHISGEVYEVDEYTLEDLDILEGNGSFYKRELINVKGVSGKVWIYFLIDKHLTKKSYQTGIKYDKNNNIKIWSR